MMIPETYLKTNVLIVGKGVSGLILNYLLTKKGIKTILLDRVSKASTNILAETIPPSTLQLLDTLNLLPIFEQNATRTYGYQSKWHRKTIHDESFFNHNPFKYGLKINKRKLLTSLTKQLHIQLINYKKFAEIVHTKEKVITSIKTDKNTTTIESDLIIDATGRKRAFLKELGVKTKTFDENLAFICYVPKIGPNLKYGFITESFTNGWGTVSHLNETTDIISLYTDKHSSLSKKLNDFSNWKNNTFKTKIIKNYIPKQGNFKVYGQQANSSIANKLYFKSCLAIGDAAIAFDPIASHGISNAIFCASEAAKSIHLFYKNNDKNAFDTYEKKLQAIFFEYLNQKEKLYNIESNLSVKEL